MVKGFALSHFIQVVCATHRHHPKAICLRPSDYPTCHFPTLNDNVTHLMIKKISRNVTIFLPQHVSSKTTRAASWPIWSEFSFLIIQPVHEKSTTSSAIQQSPTSSLMKEFRFSWGGYTRTSLREASQYFLDAMKMIDFKGEPALEGV
jgi:hypothetical protein